MSFHSLIRQSFHWFHSHTERHLIPQKLADEICIQAVGHSFSKLHACLVCVISRQIVEPCYIASRKQYDAHGFINAIKIADFFRFSSDKIITSHTISVLYAFESTCIVHTRHERKTDTAYRSVVDVPMRPFKASSKHFNLPRRCISTVGNVGGSIQLIVFLSTCICYRQRVGGAHCTMSKHVRLSNYLPWVTFTGNYRQIQRKKFNPSYRDLAISQRLMSCAFALRNAILNTTIASF